MTQSDSKVRVSEICGVVSTHSLLKSLLAFTLLGSNLFPPPVVAACVALPEIAANNAVVKILYPLPNGEVIVAGSFAEIAGKSQTNLARLTAAGDLDESFRPVTSDAIQFLVPDKQGRVIVSQGEGTELIAFRPDGSLDPTYKTEGRSYSSLAVDSQNRVLAFISQGESGFILRLLGNGRRDPDFNIVSSTNEDLSSFVLLPNDEIVFTLYDAEQFKTTIYKSDQNGRVVAGFRSWSLTGLHRLIGRRGTELLYLADSRDTPFSVGEFGIDGTLLREFSWPSRSVAAFAADPNGIPYFLAKDEGKIASFDKVIGIPLSSAFGVLSSNHFLLFSNQPQLGATIFRINSTGEVEQKIQVFQSGSPYVNSRPSAIGGLLLVGSFERVAQVDRFHLARLQSDFSLDHSFNPDKIATNFLQIGTFEFLDGGVGLVDASQVATNPVGNRILRLLPAGELDAAYLTPPAVVATNLNGQPLLLTLPNNEIIFAGSATSTVSNPLNSLVHLGQSGQLVSTVPVFDPWAAPGARFSGLAKYGANQFLVGLYISNAFTILRYNNDLTLDRTFVRSLLSASAHGSLSGDLYVQPGGKIVFTNHRLNPDGRPDPLFPSLYEPVVLPDVRILAESLIDGSVSSEGSLYDANGKFIRGLYTKRPDYRLLADGNTLVDINASHWFRLVPKCPPVLQVAEGYALDNFAINVTGEPVQEFQVEVSPDLVSWQKTAIHHTTTLGTTSFYELTMNTMQFYRIASDDN